MYYIVSIVIMLAIFFVWQIPSSKKENIQINQAANTTTKVIEKEPTINQQPPSSATSIIKKPETKNEVVVTDKLVDQIVPFTAQAPFGGWDDERQQDGCEEASALMAVYWARGEKLNKLTAWEKINNISDFEQRNYGEYRDIGLSDVVERIFKDYFDYGKVELKTNVKLVDIITEIYSGNLVLTPMDGQKLANPYFTPPGPERHMLVIRGYDPVAKEFITNDPGTKRGEAYRYKEDVLFESIRAYPTGYHEPINKIEKNIIVVSK